MHVLDDPDPPKAQRVTGEKVLKEARARNCHSSTHAHHVANFHPILTLFYHVLLAYSYKIPAGLVYTPPFDPLFPHVFAPAAAAAAAATGYGLYSYLSSRVPSKGKYPIGTLPADAYDVVIVGAGPSGSTCGYYASKAGAKVALLDKETFPRDKYCGDAVCALAIHTLNEMGVMQELEKHGEAHYADSGGFVSPSGICYIGRSEKKLGEAAACAVKRINLDKRIAWKARDTGAELRENFEVESATFNAHAGLWSVKNTKGQEVRGRLLVCADGATSRLATKLGYCTEAPQGVCSRAFVKGGTHNTDFDGVCFYQRESLPGYSAIFKHPNDELNYCYYLIPTDNKGNCGNVRESDLARLHNDAIKKDPFIARALGPNVEIERMRVAPLRLGGQGLKQNHDDHLLIIGDAAGHIDPLTGEGIHTAILGGKAAAETLLAMRSTGDFSKRSCSQYDSKIYKLFTHDFGASKLMAQAIYKLPILMDAVASETQRQGDPMMAKWAEVMTNMRSKTYFLRPDIAVTLGVAIVREAIEQYVFGKTDKYMQGGSVVASYN